MKPQTSIPLQIKSGLVERVALPKVSDLVLFPLLKSESIHNPNDPLEEEKKKQKRKKKMSCLSARRGSGGGQSVLNSTTKGEGLV